MVDGESKEAQHKRITEYGAEFRQMVIEAHSIITAANRDVIPLQKLGNFLEEKLSKQNSARDAAMTTLETNETDFMRAIENSDKEILIKAFKDHTNRMNDIVRTAIIQMMEGREMVCGQCIRPVFEQLSPEVEHAIASEVIQKREPICLEFIRASSFEDKVKQLAREIGSIQQTFESSVTDAYRHILGPLSTRVYQSTVHMLRVYANNVCEGTLARPGTVYPGTLNSISMIEEDFLRNLNSVNIFCHKS